MIVLTTDIKGLTKHVTGKVRDVYDLDDKLLIVATDRISAFDVVMANGIPDKGRVLTQMSLFWFDLVSDVTENHLITADTQMIVHMLQEYGVPNAELLERALGGRTMLVKKAKQVPVECVVRGYLAGSAWKEYQDLAAKASDGRVNLHGISLPVGMLESEKLPEPSFTPATKAASGHDENISAAKAAELIGQDLADKLEQTSIAIYRKASEYAASRGIIISDTKFEFGIIGDRVILIDEILTPDSSRFWDVKLYKPGGPQPSFDKQFVRDYLETIKFNKQPPGPELPPEIVEKTAKKYREAYRRLVGRELA